MRTIQELRGHSEIATAMMKCFVEDQVLGFGFWVLGFGFWVLGFG